jgi:aconitate hydratase 2/2-methylisocitrate dehydratase
MGGDSHTLFPIVIGFPVGSGLVAFAAATSVMPLDMPESALMRFTGEMQPSVVILRDLVHAIPFFVIKQGLLTVAKQEEYFFGAHPRDQGLAQPQSRAGV